MAEETSVDGRQSVEQAAEPEAGSGEFEEVAHSGGQITLTLATTPEGKRTYQVGMRSARPVQVVLVDLFALPQGIPVGISDFGHAPPTGCFLVFLASDSEGYFGHNCPRCHGYWRSEPWPNVCPYCGATVAPHNFLSDAQKRFVREYCHRLSAALDSDVDGDVLIDMDAVADAVGKAGAKPAFYVSEKSQQHKFKCQACDTFNDILGVYGYCSECGTRNDLTVFRDTTIPAIRDRVNGGGPTGNAVRDAVSAFDSLAGRYGEQLLEHVPLSKRRRNQLTNQRYHDAERVKEIFGWFDVDIRAGIDDKDWTSVVKLFHRRHVYEHRDGRFPPKFGAPATLRMR